MEESKILEEIRGVKTELQGFRFLVEKEMGKLGVLMEDTHGAAITAAARWRRMNVIHERTY